MASVKDFILDDTQISEVSETQTATRKTTTPDLEVVFVSGPDWAVRRKTKTSDKIMVFMTSKGQFYIKNNKNGDIDMINHKNLQAFLRGISDDFIIKDEEGHYPFWITQIRSGKQYVDALMSVVLNDRYREALTTGLVYLTEGKNMTGLKIRERLGDSGVRMLFSLLSEEETVAFRHAASTYTYYHSDIPCAVSCDKKVSSLARELSGCGRSRYSYGGYGRNIDKLSLDVNNMRYMIQMYLASPAEEFPAEIWRVLINERDSSRRLDERKVIEHLFTSGIEQGYADNLVAFCNCWGDYLNHQMDIYGRIVDKYPDNLASDEMRLAYTYRQRKEIIDKEHFDEAAEDMKKYRTEKDGYIITSPEEPVDLIDEGRKMSNCVGSYVNRIIDGGTKIFFMRKADSPSSSFIDIEIRPDGSLGQVLARFNKRPPSDALEFVNEWYRENFQN